MELTAINKYRCILHSRRIVRVYCDLDRTTQTPQIHLLPFDSPITAFPSGRPLRQKSQRHAKIRTVPLTDRLPTRLFDAALRTSAPKSSHKSNPRRASSTNPEDRAYPQLQQGDRETSLPVRRYPLLGLDVGHSCGTRKRSHPHPAFFQVSVAKLNPGKAAYRPPQEDPS
ncbi:hypothetical protein HER10_EVM0009748 [Colletotrichum scovillei]|uniref:uncharacterized protein n=1 Tax=Colletotrichum scovillei TaxID=1209932 RepID=UPI0015C34236|nr:uncharacterized protein HER10_EVM0009748 [Colletotrichum scovillei]KAF4782255.1 hypothetical protein HER10_EVM0009748 [Colletotrichum scovillei]